MCEALGSDPVDSETPVDFEDLPLTVQQILEIYSYLPDRWEGMSGTFMGKDYTIAFELFKTFKVKLASNRKLYLRIMSGIDSIRSAIISAKNESKKSS